jgi:predicted nucleic acid-binding protein
MILDTTVLIDLMNGNSAARARVHALISNGVPLAVATVSTYELFMGLAQCSKPAEEHEKIRQVLGSQTQLPLDEAGAERAGRINGELARQGRAIDDPDALIAGIALQRHEPVLTRNVKDFSRVSGLKVESY